MARRILVVEDEAPIREMVCFVLEQNGFQPVEAEDYDSAVNQLNEPWPDLILLDWMLPGGSGIQFIKHLKRESMTRDIPVVMLTARGEEEDRVRGLETGADDYITKPFGTSELLARIRTAIRHTRTTGGNSAIARSNRFTAKGLVVDYDKYRVYIDGNDANLTQNEFKLVALLGRYAGRVLTYDYLIREIWGPNKAYDNQILRVNMANIRRKIEKNPGEPQYIFTEVGVGYRMVDAD